MTTKTTVLRRQRIALDHHNARTLHADYCGWCGHAVPAEDTSKKFAQAGGALAGPFCSPRCYWDFIHTDELHEGTRADRREHYRGETA